MHTIVERRALPHLAAHLAEVFAQVKPVGAIVGRTRMRDAVSQHVGCSQLEAEELVDALVAKNFLVFEGEGGEPGVWHIRRRAGQ
jgi:hypothetical protein